MYIQDHMYFQMSILESYNILLVDSGLMSVIYHNTNIGNVSENTVNLLLVCSNELVTGSSKFIVYYVYVVSFLVVIAFIS